MIIICQSLFNNILEGALASRGFKSPSKVVRLKQLVMTLMLLKFKLTISELKLPVFNFMKNKLVNIFLNSIEI